MNYIKKTIIILASVALIGLGYWYYMVYFSSAIDKAPLKPLSIDDKQLMEGLYSEFDSNNLDSIINVGQEKISSSRSEKNVFLMLEVANAYAQKAGFATSSIERNILVDKSIALVEKAFTLAPSSPEGYRVLGYAYEIAQDFTKSVENYNKAIDLHPSFGLALANRGHVYELMGDKERAYADYQSALRVDTKGDYVNLNLARYYLSLDDLENASSFANTAIVSTKNNRLRAAAHNLLGSVSLLNEDFSKANTEFTESIKSDSNYADPYFGRAFLAIVSKNGSISTSTLTEINKDIDAGLLINPSQAYGYFLKGLINHTSDTKIASNYYKEALSFIDGDVTLVGDEKTNLKLQIDDQVNSLNKK